MKALDRPDGLHADATYADVYLNDSFEASDAISKAQALAAGGRWRQAAELLQRTLETAGDKLVRVSPARYVGIRGYINDLIAGWPASGIAAYRALYEHQIETSLATMPASRSVRELLALFDRYFCTSAAARLADTIGQLALEAGDLGLAEHVFHRVLERHPDRELFASRYRSMLTVLRVMRGEKTIDHADLDAAQKVRWMGQDRSLSDVVKEIGESFAALRSEASPAEWPIFGGDETRNRRARTGVEVLGLLWRFQGFAGTDEGLETDSVESALGGEQDNSRYLSIHPITSGGLVFAQRLREIVALHRNTGAVAWRFSADQAGSSTLSYLDEQPPGWDSVTVAGGRLYASLPGEAVPYYAYESARTPPELVCLEADSGKVVWRIDQDVIEEAFAEIVFDSAPIVEHGRLYVVGRRRRSFGFEDCYLYRFDAATGEVEHRTHLGSASTGTFGSRQATKTIASMQGDAVYVCTNLGSVAAVSAYTGVVRWLTLYQRQRGDAGQGFSRYARDAKPWHFNSAIWSDGRLLILPNDATRVMVLAAKDGTLLDSVPVESLGDLETILGVSGELLCGVGRQAVCYDLATGSVRWLTPLPDGESLYGRGVWAGDRLLVPTRKGLSVFGVADGKRSDTTWSSEGEGGNVLAMPDQLLVAGAGRICAYVKKAQIWDALRARMSSAPADPLPALELAEIALGNSEFADAIGALDEAVRRAGLARDPVDPTLGRRMFDDVLLFIERLSARARLDAKLLDKLFLHASQYAPDAPAHLDYRLRFAEEFESQNRPRRAVRLYQQILRDRTLWQLPVKAPGGGTEPAGAVARSRIDELISRHGRSVYASHDAEAKRLLESGKATKDEEVLRSVVSTFPNSRAAPRALIAHGNLLVQRGRPKEAAKVYTNAYHRYGPQVDRPNLLREISDAHELAGRETYAYRWLTKAAREHPSVRFEANGKLVTFLEYRERLAHLRDQVEPSRPDVVLPLSDQCVSDSKEEESLLVPRFGADPASRWSSYFVRTPAGIMAFDSRRGMRRWARPCPVQGNVELLIAMPQSAVFATAYEVFALDVMTGERRWTHGEYPKNLVEEEGDWEDEERFLAHALADNRLVSARANGPLSCIAIDTGRLIWSRTHRPDPTGRVRMSDPWVVYNVVQDDGVALCLVDAATGEWVDAVLTDEKRSVVDFFVTLDERLVLVTSGSISSYDPQIRRRRWRVTLGSRIQRTSLLHDIDSLYLIDDGRQIRKISLEDGQEVWESERLGPHGDGEMRLDLQGSSIVASTSAMVSAVDTLTGLTLWQGAAPDRARFVANQLTRSYVLAVDMPEGEREADSVAYFYDHRNASGLIPHVGGARNLGPLSEVRTIMAVDGALLVQTGSTISRWPRAAAADDSAGMQGK